MIWVLSQNNEKTTDLVIDYLLYLENGRSKIKRYNVENIIKGIDIKINDADELIEIDTSEGGKEILNEVGWYRRGDFSFKLPIKRAEVSELVIQTIEEELDVLRIFMHESITSLGSFAKEVSNNRLHNIRLAKCAGISIPQTLITTSRKNLKKFSVDVGQVITKPIHNGHLSFIEDGVKYSCKGVLLVTEDIEEELDEEFCPSLFQAYVEKQFELRIFFVKEELFVMAIFSQLDEMTKIDFRNYNLLRPTRNVPFTLPNDIKIKVLEFIRLSGLNTGSIDMIYSTDK
jgi:hypothetical protein